MCGGAIDRENKNRTEFGYGCVGEGEVVGEAAEADCELCAVQGGKEVVFVSGEKG